MLFTARFDPVTALHILHGLLSIGFVFSLTILHCLYVLYSTSNHFGLSCYMFLRIGLVFHVIVQLGQFPLRCLIFRQVTLVRFQLPLIIGQTNILADKIREIEQTRAWKLNQRLAPLVYANSFFICITLMLDKFWFKTDDSVASYNDYCVVTYTGWMLLVFLFVRIVGTVYWGYSYFKQAAKKGADERLLQKLNDFTYSSRTSSLYNSNCVICLSQYEDGEQLSTLPCSEKHVFHTGCVQNWLKKSRCCPLCMKEIS